MTLTRPEPPDLPEGTFAPAPALAEWVRRAFLTEGEHFWTPEHAHLTEARLVFSWTTAVGKSKGRSIVGECQLLQARGSQWSKLRDLALIREWWRGMPDYEDGTDPDFLVTLFSPWCRAAADASFGALNDHELSHAGQAVDGYGDPRVSSIDGRPVWAISGHDVEEFVGVAERWGVRALPEVERLVAAARKPPKFGEAAVQAGCGTCSRRVA